MGLTKVTSEVVGRSWAKHESHNRNEAGVRCAEVSSAGLSSRQSLQLVKVSQQKEALMISCARGVFLVACSKRDFADQKFSISAGTLCDM